MWSRVRSWSANDCLIPSRLVPSLVTEQRARNRAIGTGHGRRLEGLDLAGVIVQHKKPPPRVHSGGQQSKGLPEARRPARLSLPAACYIRAGGSPGGQTAEQGVARRQRHSVAGWRPHHLTKTGSGAACVFSTAVISGAASAPNLTDIIPNTASVSGTNLLLQSVSTMINPSLGKIYQLFDKMYQSTHNISREFLLKLFICQEFF